MKSRFIGCCLAAAGLALLPFAASAQTTSVGVGFGTQGANVELGYQVNDTWGLRLSTNYFRFGDDTDIDNIHYRGAANLFSTGLLGDFYFNPDNGFRVTGGLYYNENSARVYARPTGSVTIGSGTYTQAQVGTLAGRVTYRRWAPYAGIGYSTNHNQPGLGFTGDLGVMFQGSPRVRLTSSGTGRNVTGYAANLEQERLQLQDDASDWTEYFPVARIGIVYRF